MHFSKKISYKLAKPLTTLALVAASFGCGKDDDKEIIPEHDTVYAFGPDIPDFNAYVNQVAASADSASVRHVIIYGDNKSWGGAINMTELRELGIEVIMKAVSPKNQHKVIGGGNMAYIGMDNRDPEKYKQHQADSVWINNFGIKTNPVYYYKRTENQR